MSASLAILAAVVSVNFNSEIGKLRPELHSSGFGPLVCSCPKERVDEIGTMGFSGRCAPNSTAPALARWSALARPSVWRR